MGKKVGNEEKVEVPVGRDDMDNDNFDKLSRSSSFIRPQTLQQYTRSGNIEGMNRMLRDPEVVKAVNDLDDDGLAALHYAARANHFAAVALLIKKANADTMVRDEERATPMHYAARKMKLTHCDETVRIIKLLSLTADVNARDQFCSTPLHFAAMRGNSVAASAIIGCGSVLVNAKDKLGCTPLHEAATYNHASVAELLLQNGAKVLDIDQEKCTALHLACGEEDSHVAPVIINKCDPTFKDQLINCRDSDDKTALHYAIEARNASAVQLLLKEGADVNVRCRLSNAGSTCLHLGAIAGDENIVKVLLSKGAKIDSKDLKGATPLHKAAEYDCADVARAFLRQIAIPLEARDQDNYTPLLTAISYGNLTIVRMLLKEGTEIDAVDDEEKTAVYLAVEFDQREVLKAILREVRETDKAHLINDVDNVGNSPLHIACSHGDSAATKMLLKCGADINIKNECEETPFLLAAKNGQDKVVQVLLDKSEKVINDEDEYSNTALHHASANGHLDVVKTLVEWGADKEARNNRSRCPLDLAAAGGHLSVVEYLLSEDVSPNPLDKENITPLHLASRYGHDTVVRSLIERGADVAAAGVDSNNCLDIAIDHGHRRVAVAILESKAWHIALAHETNRIAGQPRNSPLRKLIAKMPDVGQIAMSRCLADGPDATSPNDLERYVEFNYDYLDDTHTDFNDIRKHSRPQELPDQTIPKEDNWAYTGDSNWIKENHPLMLSLKTEEEALVSHPLVIALARHKWTFARLFYFLFLIFYLLFLSTLTAYMLIATKPYEVTDSDDSSNVTCPDGWMQSSYEHDAKNVIWVLAAIGLFIELVQAFFQKFLYISFINLLDWFAYVSAIVLLYDIHNCGLRTDWQWQMGSFTLLTTWLNLILYLRRLPGLGIYIVMIVEIFRTFAMFFLPFMLFIIAFSMSFHLLLANQASFSTPLLSLIRSIVMMLGEIDYDDMFFPPDHKSRVLYAASTFAIFVLFVFVVPILVMNLLDAFSNPFFSIVKTFVMMIGELDYMDIFFNDDPDEEVVYDGVTYAVFIIFVIFVSIIIMNLLVGLAVDDVNGLRNRAKVIKLKMQIDFALDVELALSDYWKRRFKSTVRRERIYPNVDWGSCWRVLEKIQNVVEGPLMSQEAVMAGVENMESSSKLPQLMELEGRVMDRIQGNKEDIKSMNNKLDKIHALLKAMAVTQGHGQGQMTGMTSPKKIRSPRGRGHDRTPSDSEA